jgi:hypothetical protein
MSKIETSVKVYPPNEKLLGEHQYFFEYLLISPSYWLAHKKIGLKQKVSKAEEPQDFNAVLSLYKKVGDIYSCGFGEWWDSVGTNLFDLSLKTNQIWMSIDGSKNRQQLMQDFSSLLDRLELDRKNHHASKKLKLEVNKIRLTSLDQRLKLVHEKAMFSGGQFKKESLWVLGKSVRLGSKWTKHIRLDSKRSSTNAPVRTYLSILVSKNLKDALTIAENAARGRFPSLSPLPSTCKFDYQMIQQQQFLKNSQTWNELLEVGKNEKKINAILDPSNSRKKIKRVDTGDDLESDHQKSIEVKLKTKKPSRRSMTEYESLLEAEDRQLKVKLGS